MIQAYPFSSLQVSAHHNANTTALKERVQKYAQNEQTSKESSTTATTSTKPKGKHKASNVGDDTKLAGAEDEKGS